MTTINIDGAIGWDMTARDIRAQLPEPQSGPVALRINTPGGLVDEGIAIANELRAFRRNGGTVNATVTGQCCSMGTYIATFSDRLEVEDNAVWMVHNPSTIACGDHRLMAKTARTLESVRSVLARAYQERTGRDQAAIFAEMDEETWLFGEEIVTAGYADALVPAGDGPETQDEAIALAHTSFKAMLGKLKERESDPAQLDQIAALLPQPPAGQAGQQQPKGDSMTYQTQVNAELGLPAEASAEQALQALAAKLKTAKEDAHSDGTAAERERIFAIIDCAEAKGREAVAANLARVHAMNAESAAAVLAAMPKAEPAWSADSGEIRQTTDAAAGAQPKPAAIDYDAIYAARRISA